MRLTRVLPSLIILGALVLVGCMSVDLHDHIYASRSLLESPQMKRVSSIYPGDTLALVRFPDSLEVLGRYRPGLVMIARQVFADEIPNALSAKIHPRILVGATPMLFPDEAPLPEAIARLKVMKLVIGVAIAEALSRYNVGSGDGVLPRTMPTKLSRKDFKVFGQAVSRYLVTPYHEGPKVLEKCKKQLSFECVFTTYMLAYFNGEFIDRNGGVFTKPQIGLTISNETIANTIRMFLEALFDIVLIGVEDEKAKRIPEGSTIKAPIIYYNTLVATPPHVEAPTVTDGTGTFPSAQEYGYVVTAKNAVGETEHSNEVRVDVKAWTNIVTLKWSKVKGADSYNVYRTAKPGLYVSPALIANVKGETVRDTGVAVLAGTPPAANTTGKIVWITKDGKRPTLAKLAEALKLAIPEKGMDIRYVIEKEDSAKMDRGRMCVVRLVGGSAGDAAQPLAGLVVRALGGANLGVAVGLGALGKLSIGDNETLAKLADSVVENFVRRVFEAAVEDRLYGDSATAPTGLKEALELVKALGGCTD